MSEAPAKRADPRAATAVFGVVDIGSNAVRARIAEVTAPRGHRHVLENFRAPLRLGSEVFQTGGIGEESIVALVEFLERFRDTCAERSAVAIDAIGTSALRDARNRGEVVDRIRERAGIEVRVISGSEEAFLLTRAVRGKMDLRDGRSLLLDLGGGSLEVSVLDSDNLVAADSYHLGAVRLIERLGKSAQSSRDFARLVDEHVRALLPRIKTHFEDKTSFRRAVWTGGNAESLAAILRDRGQARENDGVLSFALQDLKSLVRDLAHLSVEERVTQFGLKPDRADTIVPAGIVYRLVAKAAGVNEIHAPAVGMRDGILLELAAVHLAHSTVRDHRDAVLAASRTLGDRFDFDRDHAETTRRLAASLFDGTWPLHNRDLHDRMLLEAAALLHDVGAFVSNSRHHKHSEYLIRESEIAGLSDSEREIVALTARYHRRAHPQEKHLPFADLDQRDQRRVLELSAILRVADCFDRAHREKVRDLQVRLTEEGVLLQPELRSTQNRLTLEATALAHKSALFEEVFGKSVELQIEPDECS